MNGKLESRIRKHVLDVRHVWIYMRDDMIMEQNYKNKDWLIEQYHIKKLSLKQIGKLANVTGVCIQYWMKKYNIATRPRFYHLKELNQNKKHQSLAGKARAKWTNDHYSHLASERIKRTKPYIDFNKKWKERDPIGYYKNYQKCGKRFGEYGRQRLTDWDFFNEHGMLKSQWPYPNEFNRKLKEKIFNRDSGLCRVCLKLIYNGHAIHHIDYDKENNQEENLILLCKSCHGKTMMNREYWQSFFKFKY